MTDAERALWRLLSHTKPDGYNFRRQQPIGPYIADFYCANARLIIELDGGQHAEATQAHDRKRTAWLAASGYRLLRFWNDDVSKNPAGVFAVILDYATCPLMASR